MAIFLIAIIALVGLAVIKTYQNVAVESKSMRPHVVAPSESKSMEPHIADIKEPIYLPGEDEEVAKSIHEIHLSDGGSIHEVHQGRKFGMSNLWPQSAEAYLM